MKENRPQLPADGYIRLPMLLKLFPVSKSTWYQGVSDGKYPKPCKLWKRCVAWSVADIRDLLEDGKGRVLLMSKVNNKAPLAGEALNTNPKASNNNIWHKTSFSKNHNISQLTFRHKKRLYGLSGNRAYIFWLMINTGNIGLTQATVPAGLVLHRYISAYRKRFPEVEILTHPHYKANSKQVAYCSYILTSQVEQIIIDRRRACR